MLQASRFIVPNFELQLVTMYTTYLDFKLELYMQSSKKIKTITTQANLQDCKFPQVGWEHIKGDSIVILSKLLRYELLAMEQKNNE
jgi:hypothetical protein